MPIPNGTFIGPYEVVGWLGAGGMGEVYRARDSRLAREVAIKLILEAFASDASRLHRFEQEARAAGQLNHPNILAVYDLRTHAGAPFIVSELLDMRSKDRKQAVAKQVTLWRAKDENEAIRIMEKGTPAEQKALVKKMIRVLKV